MEIQWDRGRKIPNKDGEEEVVDMAYYSKPLCLRLDFEVWMHLWLRGKAMGDGNKIKLVQGVALLGRERYGTPSRGKQNSQKVLHKYTER